MPGDAEFEEGYGVVAEGARGSVVHKIQSLGPQQRLLSSICKLLGRRRTNAIETKDTGKAKCGTHAMVRDLSNRGKAHDG